jgi:hypothetical protein
VSYPFLNQGDLATYRVTGPQGQGPYEVQARNNLEAVQAACGIEPHLWRGVGLHLPGDAHGPVYAAHVGQGGTTEVIDDKFDVAFLGWVTE